MGPGKGQYPDSVLRSNMISNRNQGPETAFLIWGGHRSWPIRILQCKENPYDALQADKVENKHDLLNFSLI